MKSTPDIDLVQKKGMNFYNQHTDTLIQQYSCNAKDGLDENAVLAAKQRFGQNILKAALEKE